MRIAAYQAPLLRPGSMAALALIERQVRRCEGLGVDVLLCPEAILGGLADDHPQPAEIAMEIGELAIRLGPLASGRVATVIGFTEAHEGGLYNSAALFAGGKVAGVYRKRHPARRRSVYRAGTERAIFRIGEVAAGVLICNDTNDPALAADLAAAGATLILVPSNNALPRDRADVVDVTRAADVANAVRAGVYVARADVTGRLAARVSHGASAIIDRHGRVLTAAAPFVEDLLTADLPI